MIVRNRNLIRNRTFKTQIIKVGICLKKLSTPKKLFERSLLI